MERKAILIIRVVKLIALRIALDFTIIKWIIVVVLFITLKVTRIATELIIASSVNLFIC